MQPIPILTAATACSLALSLHAEPVPGSNPILRDTFTADPAPLVVGDTLYLYVGHDEAKEGEMFNLAEWLCYSTKDMKTWAAHGPIMQPTDFQWAVKDAWASQVVEKEGKFYFFTTVQHDNTHGGKAIGVAVSDQPTGPFVDAKGSALITEEMTSGPYGWDDIDPTVLLDDDGSAWLAWGNPTCHLVKLKSSLIEIDGEIERIPLPNYTEGPWLAKRNGLYYVIYASLAHQGFGERMCYATAPKMSGPWTYHGFLTGPAKGSYTIHPGIAEFKGQSYLFYHNATLTLPDGRSGAIGRRAVCAEYLFYNEDGTMQPVTQTGEGVSAPPKAIKHAVPDKVDPGKSDPSIKVKPIIDFYPTEWAGSPSITTVADPFNQAPVATGLNGRGGVTSIAQTFVAEQELKVRGISLYAGDGFGSDPENSLKLALYDLGRAETEAESYSVEDNLFGAGEGFALAYEVQAPGLLNIEIVGSARPRLEAGHRYVFEIQGARNSAAIFWRRSKADVYADGAAYRDRKLARERGGKTTDFALAIYGEN